MPKHLVIPTVGDKIVDRHGSQWIVMEEGNPVSVARIDDQSDDRVMYQEDLMWNDDSQVFQLVR